MFSKLVGFDRPNLLCLCEYLLVWAGVCACLCVCTHEGQTLNSDVFFPFSLIVLETGSLTDPGTQSSLIQLDCPCGESHSPPQHEDCRGSVKHWAFNALSAGIKLSPLYLCGINNSSR